MNLRSVAVVATGTLASRILGLLRDVLVFVVLGASAFGSAFVLAFTIPNLARRLLGEGALTSAFIPVFSRFVASGDEEQARSLANAVLTRLTGALCLLTLLGMAGAFAATTLLGVPTFRWWLGGQLTIVLLPYMILVCAAAVPTAVLNVLGCYRVTSLSQVWLNLAMIASLAIAGLAFPGDLVAGVLAVAAGVLLGGVLQLLAPTVGAVRQGYRPALVTSAVTGIDAVRGLFLPALAAASVMQVNSAVMRFLAFAVDEAAASVIYIANRLIELPLGLFVISVVTVAFPSLARLEAAGDRAGFGVLFRGALLQILAISLPAAAGLIMLSEPILVVLFEWGRFDAAASAYTADVLRVLAVGLPAFAVSTLAVRAMHAVSDMRSPFRLAVVVLILNAGLGVALMRPLGATGLAVASVVAFGLHAGGMLGLLERKNLLQWTAAAWRDVAIMALGTAIVATLAFGIDAACVHLVDNRKGAALTSVIVAIPVAVAVYGGLLAALRVDALLAWLRAVKGRV